MKKFFTLIFLFLPICLSFAQSERVKTFQKLSEPEAIEEIENIQDNQLLSEIVISLNSLQVRQAERAIEKITDDTILLGIVNKSKVLNIRLAAVKNLKNKENFNIQKLYTDIVIHNHDTYHTNNYDLCKVLERIEDNQLLADIALSDVYITIQNEAIEKITDDKTLLNIAKKSNNANVIRKALFNIKNKKELNQQDYAEIALHIKEYYIANDIIDLIEDPEILLNIAKQHEVTLCKLYALGKIKNKKNITIQKLYGDIALNPKMNDLHPSFINHIVDTAILLDIKLNAKERDFRKKAQETLKSLLPESEFNKINKPGHWFFIGIFLFFLGCLHAATVNSTTFKENKYYLDYTFQAVKHHFGSILVRTIIFFVLFSVVTYGYTRYFYYKLDVTFIYLALFSIGINIIWICNHFIKNKDKKPDKTSLLFEACKNGNLKIVEKLLKFSMFSKKPDINAADNDNRTHLILACYNRHPEIVQYLIIHGADVNVSDDNGFSPLIWACQGGDIEIVKLLISGGADLNSLDNNGRSPLSWACQGGYTEIVQLLISNKAEVNLSDNLGMSPLIWACKKGYSNVAECLIENNGDMYAKTSEGHDALAVACIFGKTDIIKLLIEKGVNFHEKNEHGDNTFLLACSQGNVDIVKLLVDKGANPHEKNGFGNNGIHLASGAGHLPVIEFLIDFDVKWNKKNSEDMTPFLVACTKGHLNIVEFFIDKGVDLNTCGKDGKTPLTWAASEGQTHIVDYLLSRTYKGEEHEFFEVGLRHEDGVCSDNACACPEVAIPKGTGYLYIDSDCVTFRKNCRTIKALEEKLRQDKSRGHFVTYDQSILNAVLVCEEGANKRGLNLETAAKDAIFWWETGWAPLRPTPVSKDTKSDGEPDFDVEYGEEEKQDAGIPENSIQLTCNACFKRFHIQDVEGETLQCPHCKSINSGLERSHSSILRMGYGLSFGTMVCNCAYCRETNSGILIRDQFWSNGSFYSQKLDDPDGLFRLKTTCIHCEKAYNIAWDVPAR